MFAGLSGAGMFGMGTSVLGGVTDYLDSKRTEQSIDTAKAIAKRKIGMEQRKTRGKQVSAAAGSGVEMSGSTLDAINRTQYEYELDKAITMENFRMEKAAVSAQGKKALLGGVINAVGVGMKDAETQKYRQQMLGQNKKLLGENKPATPLSTQGFPWSIGFNQ